MVRNHLLLDWLKLDKHGEIALFRQLYLELRTAIMNNTLTAGSKLPSSRILAKQLSVSRNTVVFAYDLLCSEGYVESHPGSATQVANIETDPHREATTDSPILPSAFSRAGNLFIHEDKDLQGLPMVAAFLPGNPDHTQFPLKLWKTKISKQYHTLGLSLSTDEPTIPSSESHATGYTPLREEIARYLKISRMLTCEADQVFVFTSSRAALDFTCRMLCNLGEKVLVEEPGYDTAKVIMRLNGLTPVPVNVDQDGMQIDLQEHCDNSIRLAYVTPSHQWPTGVSLSLKRRQLLLKWALKNKSWIVEDDYDSEFRFTQTPLAALQSLDTSHRVIYTGTFSKVLTPSIQTAYLVVPRSLITVFERAFWYTVQRPPIHSQKALAEFISEGHFISHIRKMRKLYDHKQNLFIEAINQHLPIDLRIDRPVPTKNSVPIETLDNLFL